MTRNYLDWLTSMPYSVYSKDSCSFFCKMWDLRSIRNPIFFHPFGGHPFFQAVFVPSILGCELRKDTFDLKKAREILDRDHYGLADIKVGNMS